MVSPIELTASLPAVAGLAVLLGLRHATDPDHLVAVSTMVASDERRGPLDAARLGGAWGIGHALTMFACGVPLVLWDAHLPDSLQRLTEAAIGAVIVLLALRLLLRWRRGAFHLHAHDHDGARHAHVHSHARAPVHRHPHPAPRSPLTAFLVGLLHGMGGSAVVGILLVGGVASGQAAVAALVVLAAGTAVSMAALSAAFGFVLTAAPTPAGLTRAIPALGVSGALFGAWYGLAAWSVLPYPL
jgi:high-affinity nickel permease